MGAAEVIRIAAGEIGVKESPPGSNKVKYNTWYYSREVSGDSYPWCMVFVQWVFREAGDPIPYKTASCTALRDWAKAQGRWVTDGKYRAGDILIYCGSTSRNPAHTGICESASGGYVSAIEGNTSMTSMDNGGAVMRRSRPLSIVLGAVRMFEDDEIPDSNISIAISVYQLQRGSRGRQTASMQALVNAYVLRNNVKTDGKQELLQVDGSFGSRTEAVLIECQKHMGLTADGICGPKTWGRLLNG